MPSVFSRIIAGELPAAFAWQDEVCVAFMAKDALRPGHLLVVPREEVDDWMDASDDLLAHLMGVARVLARAQKDVYHSTKVAVEILGLEVPHLHIHVVPIDSMADADFARVRRDVPLAELEAEAAKLRAALSSEAPG